MRPTLPLVNAGVTLGGALASIAVAASPGLSVAGLHRATIFCGLAGTTAFGALLAVRDELKVAKGRGLGT